MVNYIIKSYITPLTQIAVNVNECNFDPQHKLVKTRIKKQQRHLIQVDVFR